MKRLIILIYICCNIICSYAAPRELYVDSLIYLIDKKDQYTLEKEDAIAKIKDLLTSTPASTEFQYHVNEKLCQEYQVYIADSAIRYALCNKQLATQLSNNSFCIDTDLNLASLYITTGMYYDAVTLLEQYHSAELSPSQRIVYYKCYKSFYDNYKYTTRYTERYKPMSEAYRDSLLNCLNRSSVQYRLYYAEKVMDNGDILQARHLLQRLLQATDLTIREQAMSSFVLARSYELEGVKKDAIKYYALSAIYDIKGNIKENTATRALASCLYEEGEIELAYLCIRSSMEDAMLCNARLRTHEVSSVLPIIDLAYRDKINTEKSQLKIVLILTIVLAISLVIALWNINRHMKKNSSIKEQLKESNVKLESLNASLTDMLAKLNEANKTLSGMNFDLAEANRIKENYIAQFLDLCSNYIIKLERYQNMLNKKAAARQLDELYKILKSKDMINEEVKELYRTFDNVFLHLYPNFITDFNALIQEEERFILRDEEELNIEMRIFALIRLGITDSSRIAQFLHYSANTIYTYRTRVRNKAAVPREDFEQEVMKIGIIK